MARFALAACSLVLLAGTSFGGTVATSGAVAGTPTSIIGVTGFQTFGNEMAGMAVTAQFGDGSLTDSCVWADLGGTSGGCTGTGGFFQISQTGDTFDQPWTLTSLSDRGLTQLILQGIVTGGVGLATGTVFDRTDPSFGTIGSFLGGNATGTTTPLAVNGDGS